MRGQLTHLIQGVAQAVSQGCEHLWCNVRSAAQLNLVMGKQAAFFKLSFSRTQL